MPRISLNLFGAKPARVNRYQGNVRIGATSPLLPPRPLCFPLCFGGAYGEAKRYEALSSDSAAGGAARSVAGTATARRVSTSADTAKHTAAIGYMTR